MIKIIKKINALLIIIFIISCTSAPEVMVDDESNDIIEISGDVDLTDPEYSSMLNTLPDGKDHIFFTAVPRMANRDDEIIYGKYELAKQIVIYSGINIKVRFATKSIAGASGHLESIEVDYDKSMIHDIAQELEIIESIRDSKGTYLKTRYRFDSTAKLNIDRNSFKDRDWMFRIPQIDGYLVSIGSVQRSRFQIDSINKADEQAIASLAKQIHVEVKNKNTSVESDAVSGFSDIKYEESNAKVSNFYVLDRWITDNGNYYHTIAICRPE